MASAADCDGRWSANGHRLWAVLFAFATNPLRHFAWRPLVRSRTGQIESNRARERLVVWPVGETFAPAGGAMISL